MAGEPYVADQSQKWTDKAYDLLVSGSLKAEIRSLGPVATSFVGGLCPRCGDHIDDVQTLTAVVPTGKGRTPIGKATRAVESVWRRETLPDTLYDDGDDPKESAGVRYERVTVTCSCHQEHPGQKDARGCGTTFVVEVAG